jgi:hypothetical protein
MEYRFNSCDTHTMYTALPHGLVMWTWPAKVHRAQPIPLFLRFSLCFLFINSLKPLRSSMCLGQCNCSCLALGIHCVSLVILVVVVSNLVLSYCAWHDVRTWLAHDWPMTDSEPSRPWKREAENVHPSLQTQRLCFGQHSLWHAASLHNQWLSTPHVTGSQHCPTSPSRCESIMHVLSRRPPAPREDMHKTRLSWAPEVSVWTRAQTQKIHWHRKPLIKQERKGYAAGHVGSCTHSVKKNVFFNDVACICFYI